MARPTVTRESLLSHRNKAAALYEFSRCVLDLSFHSSTAELSIFCMLRALCTVLVKKVSYELSVHPLFIKTLRGGGRASPSSTLSNWVYTARAEAHEMLGVKQHKVFGKEYGGRCS